MKKTLLGTLALAAMTAATAFGQDRFYEREFPVDAGVRFSLDSYKGKIAIRTDNVPTIRARARVHANGTSDAELLDRLEIKERAARDSVSLEVDYHAWPGLLNRLFGNDGGWPQVDWDIVLPDNADLVLKTYKSEISLDVPAGRVEINSYKGTGTIQGVRNSLKLDTYKGSFHIRIDKLGDLKAETYKGDISLQISDAQDFSLRAKSYKGNYRFSGLSIPVEKRGKRTEIFYTAGGGRNQIDLETYKGAFNIDFR